MASRNNIRRHRERETDKGGEEDIEFAWKRVSNLKIIKEIIILDIHSTFVVNRRRRQRGGKEVKVFVLMERDWMRDESS